MASTHVIAWKMFTIVEIYIYKELNRNKSKL
jgi:hypothetical protein